MSQVLYHRLMVPNWLRKHATWRCEYEGNDLELVIKPDTSDWENIFKVRLLPESVIQSDNDITIKLKIGVVLPEPQAPRDPMSYMISNGTNGSYSFGIQLLDPNHDYAKSGPYRAVEGQSGHVKLMNPNMDVAATVSTTSRNNPDQFEITLKPNEYFGSAYCAIDDGHKIVAQYSDAPDLTKGIVLEMYRFKSNERYVINYIEVTVYRDSDNLPL